MHNATKCMLLEKVNICIKLEDTTMYFKVFNVMS